MLKFRAFSSSEPRAAPLKLETAGKQAASCFIQQTWALVPFIMFQHTWHFCTFALLHFVFLYFCTWQASGELLHPAHLNSSTVHNVQYTWHFSTFLSFCTFVLNTSSVLLLFVLLYSYQASGELLHPADLSSCTVHNVPDTPGTFALLHFYPFCT